MTSQPTTLPPTTLPPTTLQPTTHAVIDSPVGPLTVVGRGGALRALYMGNHRHAPDPSSFGPRDERGLEAAIAQLDEYFAGRRLEFDLPLDVSGTPFQRQVWAALAAIPYGQTRSYGQVAATIGRPAACRAVGLANGRNPVSIVVPCHRVIGSGGALTGYGGGVERKEALLAFERKVLGRKVRRPGDPDILA